MMKLIFLLLPLFLLSACGATEPANLKVYLMQHPAMLAKEKLACEEKSVLTERCQVVKQAVSELRVYIEELQNDQQAFGQRILHAEMNEKRTQQEEDELLILLAVAGMNGPE